MSFLSWFFVSSRSSRYSSGGKGAASRHHRLQQDFQPASPDGNSIMRRHDHREHLYTAIREAMTRAGVLSASYKFKVLSKDQLGREFLVMVDLNHVVGDPVYKTAEMEAAIIHDAIVRHAVMVSAVYWRVNEVEAAPSKATPGFSSSLPGVRLATKPVPQETRREPIQADEVEAFQRALKTSSAMAPPPAKLAKTQRNQKFPAPMADFVDTEIVDNEAVYPTLGATQYGDLN